MKKRHSVSQNIKSYVRMITEGDIRYDFPLQRAKGQWSQLDKALLIHSITKDYDIPPVYSISERIEGPEGQEKIKYVILDGLQRLTTIEDFYLNKYPLHKDTPPTTIQGITYEIAGKTFSELDERVREAINDYTLTMFYFVNMTEDDMAEMFYRIGNGAKANKQQQLKARLGMQKASILNELSNHAFFVNHSQLTPAQIKKADNEKVIIQSLMLCDEMYSDFIGFDNTTIEKYMISLKSSDNDELFENYKLTLDYFVQALEKVDEARVEVLKKRHLPHMIGLAHFAYKNNLPEVDFGEWLIALSNSIKNGTEEEIEDYKDMFSQSASNKKRSAILDIQQKLQKALLTQVAPSQ